MPDSDFISTHDAAVQLGRLGGAKGGFRRALILTPERRSEIARGAGRARWGRANSFTDASVDDDVAKIVRPSAPSASELLITGLIANLPAEGTHWSTEARARWLVAAAAIFDLVYLDDSGSEIVITTTL